MEVPVGSTHEKERLKALGQNPAEVTPASGRRGLRSVVVDTLPDLADQEDDVIYFVRA